MTPENAKEFLSESRQLVIKFNELIDKFGMTNAKDIFQPMIIENKFSLILSDDFVKQFNQS